MEGLGAGNSQRRMNGSNVGRWTGAAGETPPQSPEQARKPPLTPRQLECLRWAGEGKSSVDIASILAISPATVDGHIADACARLGVRTRIQAIVEAYRKGWLE